MNKFLANPTSYRYLFLLLTAILIDEVLDNFLLNIFDERPILQKATFYGVFLGLQIIASPIQAGFSDFYCRRKSLIGSLAFSIISILFIIIYFTNTVTPLLFLSLSMILKGIMGNTLPLAWAGLADTKNNNYRFSLGLSTSFIAIGYLFLIVINSIFDAKKSALVILVLFSISIYYIFCYFSDLIDRKKYRNQLASEINLTDQKSVSKFRYYSTLFITDSKSIWNNFLKSKRFCLGLFGVFLPLETSFYSTHALGVDFGLKGFKSVTLLMILGYLTGVIILKFQERNKDSNLISLGYKISISSFLPTLFLVPFISPLYEQWIIAISFFFCSLGTSFIVPSLFSILSKERSIHDQGKIYGLLDSADTIALLLALFYGIFYTIHEKQIYVVCFSLITFLISRLFYGLFDKTSPGEHERRQH